MASQSGCGLGSSDTHPGAGENTLEDSASSLPAVASSGIPPASSGTTTLVAQTMNISVAEDSSVSGQVSTQGGGSAHYALYRQAQAGQVVLNEQGQFSFTPDSNFFGQDSFEYYAWDEQGASSPSRVDITVLPVPDAPVIQGKPPRVIRQNEPYYTQFVASDFDLEELLFESSVLPVWLSLDRNTGELSGLPEQADVGIHRVSLSVMDASGLATAFPQFSIEVVDVNDAPTLDLTEFPSSLDARQTLRMKVSPYDADGDQVEVKTKPVEHLSVEYSDGSLILTAANVNQVTEIDLEIIASDEHGAHSSQIQRLTLYPISASGNSRTVLGREQGVGIHIAIVGDGYQVNQQERYREHVDNLVELMKDDPAIATHIFALNIHAITSISEDSGIDDFFGTDMRTTLFDAGYFCNGIERLICADELKMFDAALLEYPHLDQLILLVNDPRFGGSGGSVAIASAYFPEIAIHEMGHSIAGLADEYEDPTVELPSTQTFAEGLYANVSALSDPIAVPWAHWIEDTHHYPTQPGQSGVGIFEGAYYRATALYRATSTSRMRSNAEHFGPVNGEQWVLSLYRSIGAVLDFGPVERHLEVSAGESVRFYLQTLFDSSLQKIEWVLDGEPIAGNTFKTELQLQLPAGQHRLEVKVHDISGLVRSPRTNPSEFHWHWELIVQ